MKRIRMSEIRDNPSGLFTITVWVASKKWLSWPALLTIFPLFAILVSGFMYTYENVTYGPSL